MSHTQVQATQQLDFDGANGAAMPVAAGQARQSLDAVDGAEWDRLAADAAEPNAFFHRLYALAAHEHAWDGRLDGQALTARSGDRLTGLIPVSSALKALKLPVPALVALQPYSPLGVPLLDAADPVAAVRGLIVSARASGQFAVALPSMTLDGLAYAALKAALEERRLAPRILRQHQRAALDCADKRPEAAEEYLRGGMGSKKLKDLRRLSHRLDEMGTVEFVESRTPEALHGALERFLTLEAAGWKGERGTGLAQSAGDRRFIETAALAEAAHDRFWALELQLDGCAIASGLMMRSGRRAFFFKIAYDETLSKVSPGVQLTVELTRRCFADPNIDLVDSTADAGHPMIDHVWRERIEVADLVIPTFANALSALTVAAIAARSQARDMIKTRLAAIKLAAMKASKRTTA